MVFRNSVLNNGGTFMFTKMKTTVTTWLPIITFCPVNKLPDLIFIEAEFGNFRELYGVRKKMRKLVSFKCMFMEDVASVVREELGADKVVVRLVFNKHRVEVSKA